MTAKQLTDSILQLAIQGKLVPQDPNDEPASVLLDRIREEKKRLVKEGKLKKKDLVETPISEDEIPFEIPDSWEWVRINDYSSKVTDFVASGSFASLRENVKYYTNKEYAILVRTKDFQTNFQRDLVYTDKHGYDFLSNSNLFGGELILPNIGASIGKVFIVPKLDYRMTLAPNTVMVRFYFDEQRDWIYSLFCSSYGKKLLYEISSSTAQGKFNKTEFKQLVIPIPPLTEQQRIVQKLEEIIPLVDEYGVAYEEETKLNAELPEKLKKSILQEAIMGKLGTQDPNDEPASVLLDRIREEKKQLVKAGVLKKKDLVETPVEENEIPFEIPESWEWVRYKDIANCELGKTKNPNEPLVNLAPYLCAINVYWGRVDLTCLKEMPFSENERLKYSIKPGDMLICEGGEAGRTAIWTEEYKSVCYQNALHRVRFYSNLNAFFYMYQMFLYKSAGYLEDYIKGETIKHFVLGKLQSLPIPLPPLAEQHRIVEKIEALFAEVDHMEI